MAKKRLYRIVKRVFIAIILLLLILAGVIALYMQRAEFGKLSAGERLARNERSPNYKDGRFEDRSITPTMAEGHNIWSEMWKSIAKTYPHQTPIDTIPSIKTDLLQLSPDSNVIVWFGHSSCFIQLNGKRILLDPNFSGNASPVPGTVKAYKGSNNYSVSDLPEIDYLLISHDHYDHLDYKTALELQSKTKHVICGLGVGADFEYWGYPAEKIHEKDWHDKEIVDSAFTIYAESTRHQSGRTLKMNQTLWLSYIIKTPRLTIFISGDGGYDTHFAEIGKKYAPIDLALIENGQYDSAWRYIHLLPVQTLMAARDLGAKRLMPIHNSKFLLGRHAWNAPMTRLSELDQDFHIPLVTPMIGQIVNLNDSTQRFTEWWKTVR